MSRDTTRKADMLPWKDEISNTLWYRAFRETGDDGKVKRYIFVIKDKNGSGLSYAMHSCFLLATTQQTVEGWGSYLINVPVGPESGQEIDQIYIELKPVRKSNVSNNVDG